MLRGDVDGAAEIQRVEWLHVAGNEHYVVGRLVEYHQLAIAVIDKAARRIYGLFEKSVRVGRLLILLVVDLQVKEPYKVYETYQQHETADNVFAFF